MKRRELLISSGLILGLGAITFINRDKLFGSSIETPDSINIAVFDDFTPQRYIKDTNLLEQRFSGSTVTYQDAISGPNVVSLMEREAVDIATIGSVPAAIAITRRLPYKIVSISKVVGSSEALATKTRITNTFDLIGKKIAVTKTSTANFSLISWFNKISLPYCDSEQCDENSVNIVYAEPTEIIRLWESDQIFGAFTWYTFLDRIKADGGVVVVDTNELIREGIIVCDIVMMRDSLINEYPDFCEYYVNESNAVVSDFKDSPMSIVEGFANPEGIELSKISQTILDNPWLTADEQNSLRYFGSQDNPGAFVELLQGYALFLAKQGVLLEADVRRKGAVFYRRSVFRF